MLPNSAAAARAFTNLAHDELHLLAADDRLDRSLAAEVLTAMQQVEAEIAAEPQADDLGQSLDALYAAVQAAGSALGEKVDECDSA